MDLEDRWVKHLAIYCGTDITSVERIKESIHEFGDTFLKRIYTEQEIAYCESRKVSKYQSYAARFAAKEAAYKALSTQIDGMISWQDAEVTRNENGKPYLKFHGELEKVANRLGIQEENVDISLSHDTAYAVATVVIENKEN